MPPAPKAGTKNGAIAAEEKTTGAGNASTTSSKGRTRRGKTAVKEFEDKYISTHLTPIHINSPTQPDQSKLVVGSLKRHIEFWEKIKANEFILSVIRDGYKIPFYQTPHSAYFKNNKSALNHSDFVSAEISELLRTGRIHKVPTPPAVVNPLSVDEKDGKCRLILDLRYVNLHVHMD